MSKVHYVTYYIGNLQQSINVLEFTNRKLCLKVSVVQKYIVDKVVSNRDSDALENVVKN